MRVPANSWIVDNDINGEAVVALVHEDLKNIDVNSIGHRLLILKSIHDVKVAQDIPIEDDHYKPLSMMTSIPLYTC